MTDEVISKIEYYLNHGNELDSVCEMLGLKFDTVRRAIKGGRINPSKDSTQVSTKSDRSLLDDKQQIGKACTNTTERILALKTGKSCELSFSDQTDLQHAGVLLALPSLLMQGLLRYQEAFTLENVYYPSSSVFISLAILALLRVKTLSGVSQLPSGELGRMIGLDRIPEVKTLRSRIAKFSEITNIKEWSLDLSKDWMQEDPELSAVLYIDGHVKLFYGKGRTPPKRFVSRMRLSLSGTTDYWVNDALGQPFFVINKTISAGLIDAIKNEFIDQFLKDVPNQPSEKELEEDKYKSRFMLVFDREGYSPDFFYDLWQKRISIATYKKNVTDQWQKSEFSAYTGKLPFGTETTVKLAERGVLLQNKKSKKKIWAREIRKRSKSGHQTSIITTNFSLPILLVGLYMFARWSQENFFKYMMEEFGIDTLISYFKEKISDTSTLVNPAYRVLESQRKKITSKQNQVRANFSKLVLTNAPIEKKKLEKYLMKKQELITDIEYYQNEIEKIKEKKKEVPYKLQFKDLPENQKFDQVINQRKHFLDTLKLIAYRAETALSNIIKPQMSHKNESRLLLKQIYKTDANLKVDPINKRLIVEIHKLAHWKDDRILEKLCTEMNLTETKFPNTDLVLFYKTVSS